MSLSSIRFAGLSLGALLLLPAQETAIPLGAIEGMVTEAPGGAPAPKIPIDVAEAIEGGKWSRATTDAAGCYAIKDLRPGKYMIVARGDVDGYGKTISGTLTPPEWVQLAPGQRLTVDLVVKKEVVLSGRVLDSDRNPVVNARIGIWGEAFVHGSKSFAHLRGVRTDDLGGFRVSGLADGRYFVEASPTLLHFRKRPSGAATEPKPRPAHVGVFYPNAPSPDSAAPIYLEAGGRHEGIDLVLPKRETYCVDATIPAASADVSVSLVASHGGWSRQIASGYFPGGEDVEVCGVPPGLYRLQAATWNDEGFASYGGTDFVLGERHVSLGKLHLSPGLKVPGRVIVADAKADDPFPAGITVWLMPKGRQGGFKGENTRAQAGSSGDFTIPNARADEYWLRVQGLPEKFYVKEARMGVHDATREPVRPGSGELTIVLGSDGASVSGTVAGRDRELPPYTVVVLAPASLPSTGVAGLVRTQQADRNGQFQFASVAPGEYRLLAFTGLLPGEGENPDFLRRHTTKAEEVSLRPREAKTTKLGVLSAR